jgi:peptidoglycan/xylan/chitin deacetylase (PgdA/CDA1 family)
MYHRIGEPALGSIVKEHYVKPALFEQQLLLIKRLGYSVVSLTDMRKFLGGDLHCHKPIVLTFDDGYESFATRAVPLLASHRMAATVFAVSDYVGSTNAWDEAKGDVTEPLMTAEQLRACIEAGMRVGSHSKTHPNLPSLEDADLEHELVESKQALEAMTGTAVDWFCYPYGANGPRERAAVRTAGYAGACATGKAFNTGSTDPYGYARINVRSTTSVPYLMYKLFKARRKPSP